MDKVFCKNLREARLIAGLTQKQIAEQIGVVESCYANWEQGRTEPNICMIRLLSEILDTTPNELINGKY